MKPLASLSRGAFGALLAVHLVSACGGQSFDGGEGEGGTGSGSQAGTPGSGAKGGSVSHAGTSSTAGRASTGGAPGTAGSSTGTAGIYHSDGAPNMGGASHTGDECTAPAVTGNCEAAMPRWFHDPSTGICRPFTYGGCGGNANNYQSLAECQDACHGGSPNYDACTQPSECVVTGTGCCGVCDSPNLSEHDFIAYSKAHANDVLGCSAGAVACAPCPPVMGGTRQYFVPNCVSGECVVEDVRASEVTSCKTAMDCRLRSGTSCCEGCGSGELIAVRNDGSFEKLVCGGAPQPCAACLPVPPVNATAICNAGRCEVAYLATTD